MTRRSVQIASQLERDILSGEIAAGELINEVALATRFGVSRTPVREALLGLSSTGLVRLEPGRGAIVVGFSLQQIFDSYAVLSALWGLAAQLCAEQMSALERAQLLALHEEMGRNRESAQRDTYSRLDDAFHEAIVKGSGNAVLAHQIAVCVKAIASVRHASIGAHESLEVVYDEHAQIVAAIAARDGEAARRAMSGHLQLRGDKATRLIAAWQKTTQGAHATA